MPDKPTPAAMWAAEAMVRHLPGAWLPLRDLPRIVESFATIIDRETGLPEMLEALRDIVDQYEKLRTGPTPIHVPADLADLIRVFGKRAIAKAEGRE